MALPRAEPQLISGPALAAPPFADAADHLAASFGWLQRLLAWQVDLTRLTFGALADDAYRGLYIPEQEAEHLSTAPRHQPLPPEFRDRRLALAEERETLAELARVSVAAGVNLPLERLAERFNLGRFERDVLLLALASEEDLRFERLFAFVQDDVTRKRPSVDLAFRLLLLDPTERPLARAAFSPDAPLIRNHLIELFEEGQRFPPLLARFIKADDRIVAEVLGDGASLLDPQLGDALGFRRPVRRLDDLVLRQDLIDRLRRAAALAVNGRGLVLGLLGGYGSGRRAIAEAICGELGLPLVTVDMDTLTAEDIDPTEAALRATREARLRGAALLWEGASRFLTSGTGMETEPRDGEAGISQSEIAEIAAWRPALLAALREHDGLAFVPLVRTWDDRGALGGRFLRIDLPEPSYDDRERIWHRHLGDDAPDGKAVEIISGTFRLSPGQIRDAVNAARTAARLRGDLPTPADLAAACRGQASGRLDGLATKVLPTYGWGDIVLPYEQFTQLREMAAQVRNRRTVLGAWGFDGHLAMGKGLNALFAGPSGTGKTMAAEIIASDLGLELYKVDLSSLVSKYIGETEKNLDRIFDAAREANAILFFDEADAIFGKRSEVKDAHDRYANIEVGYLLQKMEAYDGVVILATNLRKNLDDAFIRRLHAAVDFPFPEEPDRVLIWQKVFPEAAPLDPDVDLAFLARQFRLTGGNIRNIALLAAFLAADDGDSIGMAHLVRATKREYQKLGKLLTESDFGKYFVLIRGEEASRRQA